mmetsp:Transcript_7331/g.19028  ORF Transcript_7331/g.19028 Transcript_7331/m.19028 type:complete len:1112 (-) Transcript_7331:2065-5400(-)
MEVDPPATAAAGAAPATAGADGATAADPMQGSHRWELHNFSQLPNQKQYSAQFLVGGYFWRILIFPKGNNSEHLSVYLDASDSDTQAYGWSRYASFTLTVVSQFKGKDVKKDSGHQFNARESDWGFTQFLPVNELMDPDNGFLHNDTLVVFAEVHVQKSNPHLYDSYKETGHVGLKNQGATCYMNSLLQTLYHLHHFRKAVYHMPTAETEEASKSIPLALQSLFYKLQYGDTSVATKELTASFGWDTYDSFMQHDVQELNRVLCEKLEEKMKSTVVENTIQKLFEGSVVNYIECINVNYKSERKETYMDLQLDVKGCKDVYASFDKYVEVERLDGENKYQAGDEHGLQDARKGVLFEKLPPVLELQLKRFEYDFHRDTMVKINDRYEFPERLDLDVGNRKYFSPSSDRSQRNVYLLHSVLVHSGGVHGGHYYAYIRPTLEGDAWFKFDDERVTKETTQKATVEQFGGSDDDNYNHNHNNNNNNFTPPAHGGFRLAKFSNAYMLVYVRESDKDEILCNVDKEDILPHVRERLQREQEEKEKRRKEKQEAHLYTIIKVAMDRDIKAQIGTGFEDRTAAALAAGGGSNDMSADVSPGANNNSSRAIVSNPTTPASHTNEYFDLVDHEKVRHFRVQKQMTFNDFKQMVEKEMSIPVECQRYWMWAKRQNQTYRPSRPLTHEEESMAVALIRDSGTPRHEKTASGDLKLFLETPALVFGNSLHKGLPPPMREPLHTIVHDVANKRMEHLLFFKLYDPYTEMCTYVGRAFAHRDRPMSDLLPALWTFAGYPHGTPLLLFEEVKYEPVMIEEITLTQTLSEAQLEDGDIICYQRVPEVSTEETAASAGGAEVVMRDAAALSDGAAAADGHPRYDTVVKFLEYVRNRQIVRFLPLDSATQRSNDISIQSPAKDGENDDSLYIELSRNSRYDDVTAALAHRLGENVNPQHIRLTQYNAYSSTPKPAPMKYQGIDKLMDMLTHYHQISDRLYYEVLDIPLPLMESLKTLKVSYHDDKTAETSTHTVRLKKDKCIGDVLGALADQLSKGVGSPGAGAPKPKAEPATPAAEAPAPAPAPAPAATAATTATAAVGIGIHAFAATCYYNHGNNCNDEFLVRANRH